MATSGSQEFFLLVTAALADGEVVIRLHPFQRGRVHFRLLIRKEENRIATVADCHSVDRPGFRRLGAFT